MKVPYTAALGFTVAILGCDETTEPTSPDDKAPPAVPFATLPLSWPTLEPAMGNHLVSQGFAEFDDGEENRFHSGLDIRGAAGCDAAVRAAVRSEVSLHGAE